MATREEFLDELSRFKEGRLAARKDARSGNPAKRASGERGVAGLTEYIRRINHALREMDKKKRDKKEKGDV